jgi:hypothetical protein
MRFIYLSYLILFCSCQKYLDKKNNASLAVPKKIHELQAMLDDLNTMNLRRTPGMLDGCADDHFISASRMTSLTANTISAYTWNFPEYNYQNDWSVVYTFIYNTNYCLDELANVQRTSNNESDWNNVKGSAHFFRAFGFLKLLWLHAKVYDPASAARDYGIVLAQSSDINVPSVRSSVEDGYRQVIRDIHEALPLLPQPSLNIFRPSKVAAYALLSRTYLSMRQYDSAWHYANVTLSIKSELLDYNSINVDARVPFVQYENPEFIFYTDQLNSPLAPANPTTVLVDTLLFSSYAMGDLRGRAFFQPSQGYYTYKGGYTANRNIRFSGLATDEIVLIRAECHARSGRTSEAMTDLNRLLQNRWDPSFSPLVASNSGEALRIILNERRKELVFRGLRWIDIKRLNAEGAGIVLRRIVDGRVYELPPNDPRYAVKLPADVVRISGIPQNE